MKLQHLLEPLLADFRTVIQECKLDWIKMDHGKGLKAAWLLLDIISSNRAYDDSHPRWKTCKRVLPYDGRDYCFYYVGGANDDHVRTLLKHIKDRLDIEHLSV